MSWKEFNDWAEQENKKKGQWIPIVIALIVFTLAKAYKYLANQTKMKNIKGIVIGILVIITTAAMMWSVR